MKWFEKYQTRLEDALGPGADPHPFCTCAADRAAAIDPVHPDSERLSQIKDLWTAVRRATFPLCQLLPDNQEARWPSVQAIQCLVMATLKEHQTLDENTCAEVVRCFENLCVKHGVTPLTKVDLIPQMLHFREF